MVALFTAKVSTIYLDGSSWLLQGGLIQGTAQNRRPLAASTLQAPTCLDPGPSEQEGLDQLNRTIRAFKAIQGPTNRVHECLPGPFEGGSLGIWNMELSREHELRSGFSASQVSLGFLYRFTWASQGSCNRARCFRNLKVSTITASILRRVHKLTLRPL